MAWTVTLKAMNQFHLLALASPEWRTYLVEDLLPWVLGDAHLGDAVLEIGPGPGQTTDVLRTLSAHVTAVEIDALLAERLRERMVGTNVDVLHADASQLPLPDSAFSSAACFTMLHHVPSRALQQQVFAEVHRALASGGILLGCDTIDSPEMRLGHADDTFVPIPPEELPGLLRTAGFIEVETEVRNASQRFLARKA